MGAHDVPPLRSPHQGTRRLSLLPILHLGGIPRGTNTAQPDLRSIISVTSYASLASVGWQGSMELRAMAVAWKCPSRRRQLDVDV